MTRFMLRPLLCLVAALWFSMSATLAGATPSTPEATPSAGGIVAQQVLKIPDGQPFALSPDGLRIAAWQQTDDGLRICAYDTASHSEERCVPFPGHSVEPGSGVWSSDGTRLAFTEAGIRFFDETDIWVFDVEAETVTDLTDDQKSGSGSSATLGTGIPLDFAPTWSPDGTEIVFARSMKTGEETENTTLYRIPVSGGEPVAIAKVSDRRRAVVAGIRWLADGTIFYTVDQPDASEANGLWAIAPNDASPRPISSDIEGILVDVSRAGQALVLSETGIFSLVDLATGNRQSLKAGGATGTRMLAATFSPDGTQLLYETRDGLVLRDLATGADRSLGQLDHKFASALGQGGMTWAQNGVVFGPIEANWGQIVRLG